MGEEASIADRWEAVRERIERACGRAGRSSGDLEVVVVSKKHPPETIEEAARAGIDRFGENRVQEAIPKIEQCSSSLTWHMVGHLQRNKVRPAVQYFSMIHSVDSARLLDAVEAMCEQEGKRMPVCLQVNVSGEKSKFGMAREELETLEPGLAELSRVEVVGLMTIPPFSTEPEDARPYFRSLRELAESFGRQAGLDLKLSMGMSGDFEVAIEEGADWIRLGTAVLGERPKRSAGQ